MKHQAIFERGLTRLRQQGEYRIFADLERDVLRFPHATLRIGDRVKEVSVWCGNDYLGMGVHPVVRAALKNAVDAYGVGAGGTRNIAGTNHQHVLLERELADWHGKDAALLFTSGYVANLTTLATLGANIPDMEIFSDENNHNSIIEGVRHSRAPKHIWKHNDYDDLNRLLGQCCKETPKLVVFESVYSMDGDIAPIQKIVEVAEAHNAMTLVDEVHAVGLYGEQGAGIAARDGVSDQIDIIQGTLGKAVGVMGGYITGNDAVIDFVRSFGSGFIFTTSLPPALAAASIASIQLLRGSGDLRQQHQERATTVKVRLAEHGVPVALSASHIVPVMVGNALLCKRAAAELLERHGVYVQPISYPTVAQGGERLRLTPTPMHDNNATDHLCKAMADVWQRLDIAPR